MLGKGYNLRVDVSRAELRAIRDAPKTFLTLDPFLQP